MNDLNKYLVPVEKYRKQANICFNCQRACGDCPWSEIDPETDKPRFQPVPGWTAKRVILRMNVRKGSALTQSTVLKNLLRHTASLPALCLFRIQAEESRGNLRRKDSGSARYAGSCSSHTTLCRAKGADIRNRERQKMTRKTPRKTPKNVKAVISTDIETGKETRYTSITEAAETINGSQGRISTACMNGYQYKGRYWRKESDVDVC